MSSTCPAPIHNVLSATPTQPKLTLLHSRVGLRGCYGRVSPPQFEPPLPPAKHHHNYAKIVSAQHVDASLCCQMLVRPGGP